MTKLYNLENIKTMSDFYVEYEKLCKKTKSIFNLTKFDMLTALISRGMDLKVAYELVTDANYNTQTHYLDFSMGWFKV